MTKKQNIKPTDSELEILQILWQKGPATVKSVNEILSEKKDVGYTTTLKLMQIMYEKGLVHRNEKDRSHIYTAVIEENKIQKALVEKLLETAFSGSAAKLVMQALGNSKPTKEELDKIRELLNNIERGDQ
ncbi:MAG: BlaI/MecI/CopY family transcriptional regulator [Melioribacteraceae bacterium]|jgi:predicted transcriptional regulator|nr:BlaI/MecI/CopY family transcriptional regulator [Melioribacteraceae bacterium]